MRYLAAKRAVEAKLMGSSKLRPIMYRPSLIWSWDKLDVLPVIPVFNIARLGPTPMPSPTPPYRHPCVQHRQVRPYAYA